ncbi:MAG TPA: CDP-glycerol glycerophosphotransferase family protein [Candidatus Saccharimonadales bacterium]|nr:CDP-glycerol glycerophosphotransferase family protein [Candidatus Saccharimonadales bacterium]
MNTRKIACLLMAFEDVGSGRTLEVYYKSLLLSPILVPIMVYTNKTSFLNSPKYISNKILFKIPGVSKSKSLAEVNIKYKVWFNECKRAIKVIKNLLGSNCIWITDNVWPELEKEIGKNIVQVFHGELFDVGLGSYFDYPKNLSFKKYLLIFVHGKLMRNRVIQRCGLQQHDKRIHMVGRVLNDTLYDGSIKKGNVLKQYGLDGKRNTILYAPSWESKRIWPIGGQKDDVSRMKDFCKFCETEKINLVIRPHPITIQHHVSEQIFKKFAKKFSNVYIDNPLEPDSRIPNKSIVASDILVTDLSSIALDAMSMGKPAVFIYPDKIRKRRWGDNLPSIKEVEKVSYTVENLLDLENKLHDLLSKKEKRGKITARRRFVNYAFSEIKGKSGKLFRSCLENCVKQKRTEFMRSKFTLILKVKRYLPGIIDFPYTVKLSAEAKKLLIT